VSARQSVFRHGARGAWVPRLPQRCGLRFQETEMPSRHNGRADHAVIAMLKGDHVELKKAFDAFEKLHKQQDEEACAELARHTCQALKAHAELEEQLFYPAARELLDENDMMEEALVEHATFKMLMQQLETLDAGDPKHAATFTVLAEYVKHHVQEEEKEMFPRIERAHGDWSALLEAMRTQHEALKQMHGVPSEMREAPPARARSTTRSAGPARGGAARPHAAGESDDED
jgi:hemerythrin-like domain-containing protein